jgi:hypothetical protein
LKTKQVIMKFSLALVFLILFFGVTVKAQTIYAGVVPSYCQLITGTQTMGLNCSNTAPFAYFNLDDDTTMDAFAGGSASCPYSCSIGTCYIYESKITSNDASLEFLGYNNYGGPCPGLYENQILSLSMNNSIPTSNPAWGTVRYLFYRRSTLYCSDIWNYWPIYSQTYIGFRKKYANNFYLYGWILKMYQDGGYAEFGNYTQLPAHASQLLDTVTCGSSYTFVDSVTLNNLVQDTTYISSFVHPITGRDSVVVTKLTVLPQYSNPLLVVNDTVCGGQLYNFPNGGSLLMPSGDGSYFTQIYANLPSVSGCDSADVQMNVRVENPRHYYYNVGCTKNITLNNALVISNLTHDSIYHFPSVSPAGCPVDSIYHIDVMNSQTTTTYDTVNCGGSYTFPDSVTINNIISTQYHIDTVSQYPECLVLHQTVVSVISALNPVVTSNGYYLITTQPYLTYQWYLNGVAIPGATSCTHHPLQLGDYSVMVNDSNGCPKMSALYYVNTYNPSPNVTNVTICNHQTPYLWNGQNITSSGSYTFVSTNVNGCDSTAILNLTVQPNPTATSSLSICANQTPFVWNGYHITSSGSYIGQVNNTTGCDSILTLHLTVDPNPTSTFSHSICSNQTPFIWNGQSLFSSGTYMTQIEGNMSCDSIAILNLLVHDIPNSTIHQSNTKLATSPYYISYQWYHNGISILNANDSLHLAMADGKYEVFVTDSNNCSGYSSPYWFISESTLDSYDGLFVFPNPTSGILHIAHSPTSTRKNLYNTLGQLLLTTDSNEMDLSALAAGLYYLRYEDKVWKVVKE